MLLLFYFVGRNRFFQTFVTYSFIIELHVRDLMPGYKVLLQEGRHFVEDVVHLVTLGAVKVGVRRYVTVITYTMFVDGYHLRGIVFCKQT